MIRHAILFMMIIRHAIKLTIRHTVRLMVRFAM